MAEYVVLKVGETKALSEDELIEFLATQKLDNVVILTAKELQKAKLRTSEGWVQWAIEKRQRKLNPAKRGRPKSKKRIAGEKMGEFLASKITIDELKQALDAAWNRGE